MPEHLESEGISFREPRHLKGGLIVEAESRQIVARDRTDVERTQLDARRTVKEGQALLVPQRVDVFVKPRHQQVDGQVLADEYLKGRSEHAHSLRARHLIDRHEKALSPFPQARKHLLERHLDIGDGGRTLHL